MPILTTALKRTQCYGATYNLIYVALCANIIISMQFISTKYEL